MILMNHASCPAGSGPKVQPGSSHSQCHIVQAPSIYMRLRAHLPLKQARHEIDCTGVQGSAHTSHTPTSDLACSVLLNGRQI
jgi:hypothetical protein